MIELLINGERRPSSSGAVFERWTPNGDSVASVAAASTLEDVVEACRAAECAFGSWSDSSPSKRRALLLKAADAVDERAADFARAMAAEIGATPGWAAFNVHLGANMLREAAGMTSQIRGDVIPSDKPGALALAIPVPAGVCLGIAPWNAPVILGIRAVAMALACGNSVILKASEICPETHSIIGEALCAAGFPDGVVNVLHNAPEQAGHIVDALIANPAVRRVNFTGSTHVGRIIAQSAARHLKPVLLELGGKAPCVILDDADLDAAVAGAAFGAFMNQGQICMSTERIVVDEAIADAFVQRLGAKAQTLKAGREGLPLGSMVSCAAANKVNELVSDALLKGATLLAGGGFDGPYVDAIVIDHVTPEMRLYTEESFGPVVAVVRASGDQALANIANDSEFGLSAAVFGKDMNRALAVARSIRSGICHINGPTVHDEPQMPFGGVKDSGYGRFGGTAAISEFTDLRWITIENEQHYAI